MFISDLHLRPGDPTTHDVFYQLIDTIVPSVESLFILGDLFDLWYGQVHLDYYQSVLNKLSKTGMHLPIYFLPGNRDFLISHELCQQYNLRRLSEQHRLALGSNQLLLCHGDDLCQQDRSYQRMRTFVQHRLTTKLFLALPLSVRQKLAQLIQTSSQSACQYKTNQSFDICSQSVDQRLTFNQCNLMIHGHVHQFKHQQHNNGRRIVLDSWQPTPNYLTISHDGDIHYYQYDGRHSTLIYQSTCST